MIRGIHHGLVVPLTISIVLLQLAFVPSSFAVEPDEILNDPALEQRARTLSAELRCLVCQNQNLADSNAELAKDLRERTFEMINAGASDEDIVDFMIARYGDFVIYKPPFRLRTALLWGGPFAILLIALIVFFFTVRRSWGPKDLDNIDREAAARLLDKKG